MITRIFDRTIFSISEETAKYIKDTNIKQTELDL